MHLLYILLILLLVTRIGSEIAVRLKQPAMVGELLGGVLLGILIVSAPDSAEAIALGFLAPVFFASIGILLNVTAIAAAPLLLLLLAATVGKLAGASLFDHPDPTPPAIDYLFSAIVIMAIVTTLSTPIALRWLLPAERGGK